MRAACEDGAGAACTYQPACAGSDAACCVEDPTTIGISLLEHDIAYQECHGEDGTLRQGISGASGPVRVAKWFADKRATWSAARANLAVGGNGMIGDVPAPSYCDGVISYPAYSCQGGLGVSVVSDANNGIVRTFDCALGTCAGTSNACASDDDCDACTPAGTCRGDSTVACTYANEFPVPACTAANQPGECVFSATPRAAGDVTVPDTTQANTDLTVPQCLFANENASIGQMNGGCGGENLNLLGTSLPCAVNNNAYLSDVTKDSLNKLSEQELGLILDAYTKQVQDAVAAEAAGCGEHLAGDSCRSLDPAYWQATRFVNDVHEAWGRTQPTDFVFVVDVSGSMSSRDGGPTSRLDRAIAHARTFLSALDPSLGHRAKLVTFSTDVDHQTPGVWEGVNVNDDALDNLDWTHVPAGWTSIGDGMNAALDFLANASSANENKVIILVTDGAQNTASCISHENDGSSPTGSCPAGPDDVTKQMLIDQGVSLCSIVVSNLATVDYQIVSGMSDALYEGDTGEATFKAFLSCLNDRTLYTTASDPSYLLQRNGVASAPAFETLDDNASAVFVGGWEAKADNAGDIDLLVTLENGDLLTNPDAFPSALSNVQRMAEPTEQTVRVQHIRKHHRFVNGFTTDAFADPDQGIDLVRRELHRLCPVAWDSGDASRRCQKVLYFEDGRANAGNLSVYAEAIAAEMDKVLPPTLVEIDSANGCTFDLDTNGADIGIATTDSAACLQSALESGDWDLLVYANQLSPSTVTQPYDAALESALCETDMRAVLTEARLSNVAADTLGGGFTQCSGAMPDYTRRNVAAITDNTLEQRLVDGTIALRACWDDNGDGACSAGENANGVDGCTVADCGTGYVTSWGLGAFNWDAFRDYMIAAADDEPLPESILELLETMAANALEAGIPNPGATAGDISFVSGSIVASARDRVLPLPFSFVEQGDPDRTRVAQRVFYQSEVRGNVRVEGDSPELTGSGLTAVLRAPMPYSPAGGFSNVHATAEITYPTMHIDDAAASALGCAASTDPDAPSSTRAILPGNIPTATETYVLSETDFNTWSVTVPTLGSNRGSYSLRYVFEGDYVDANGASHTAHLEARESRFLGNADGSSLGLGAPGEDCVLIGGGNSGTLEVHDITARLCGGGHLEIEPNVSFTGTGTISGRILSVDGQPVGWTIPGDEPVQAPPGVMVIRWAATDGSGLELASALQTITVTTTTDSDPACCAPGQIYSEPLLSFLPNVVTNIFPVGYCIFSKGGGDIIVTGPVADTVLGGSGNDWITNVSDGGISYGGTGNDLFLDGFAQTSVYGGAGDDDLTDLGGGLAEGNAGADDFFGFTGDHTYIGGPGRDRIYGALLGGDDTLIIYDACEVVAGEVYEGGGGHNTLISPLSPADLAARGVFVLNIDEWVSTCPSTPSGAPGSGCVDSALSYLSECR